MLWITCAATFSSGMNKEDIAKVCNAVAEWQINHQSEVKHHPLDWTNGALYRGMTEWGKVSGNKFCYDFVYAIGENIIGICGIMYIMRMIYV